MKRTSLCILCLLATCTSDDLTADMVSLAELLTDTYDPLLRAEVLDEQRLDFSVESLNHINQYLDVVHNYPATLSDEPYFKIVLRTGAYLGETLRRNAPPGDYRWLSYEQAASDSPTIRSMGENIGTLAVLQTRSGGFVFPLAKVAKYIENGEEENLYFYARFLLHQASE